jgi:hypothetical protein
MPPRLYAGGRREHARDHLHRLAADRGPGPGGGHPADRAGRAAGAADPGRAAAGGSRRHDPGGPRGRPPGPGSGGGTGRDRAGGGVRHGRTRIRTARRPDPGRTASRRRAGHPRARTRRVVRPARRRRGRPGPDLRLQPGPGPVRPQPGHPAAGSQAVEPGHAGRPGPRGRDRARGLPPVRRSRLDCQFTEQRRRGGGPHRGLAGRLPAADHAPRGQPRTGAGHDPGRPGRRAAARRAPGAPRRGPAAASRAGGDPAALRGDPPGAFGLAAAGPRAPPAPGNLRLNR